MIIDAAGDQFILGATAEDAAMSDALDKGATAALPHVGIVAIAQLRDADSARKIVKHLRGRLAGKGLTTDQLMALTRR